MVCFVNIWSQSHVLSPGYISDDQYSQQSILWDIPFILLMEASSSSTFYWKDNNIRRVKFSYQGSQAGGAHCSQVLGPLCVCTWLQSCQCQGSWDREDGTPVRSRGGFCLIPITNQLCPALPGMSILFLSFVYESSGFPFPSLLLLFLPVFLLLLLVCV